MHDALVIQQPAAATRHLALLFHGVGAGPEDLRSLGQAIALDAPDTCVVSVRSPDPSDFGSGWQWFSVRGIDEANRPARVAATLPRFLRTVQHWQQVTGMDAARTTLIGFSQGAIMALESSQENPAPASRIVAIAGRFAASPRVAHAHLSLHFVHGERDPVMASTFSITAAGRLAALGAQATVDLLPALGHAIDQRVIDAVVRRMRERPAEPI